MCRQFVWFRSMLVGVVVLVSGCKMGTLVDRDVSQDEHFLIGYRPGQVYRLTQPVSLLQNEQDGSLELLPPGAIRKYGKPAGTLLPGAQIKIISLRHYVIAAPVNWEAAVAVRAQLIGPPDRAAWIGAISDVRWIDGDYPGLKTSVLLPDPTWLQLTPPATTAPAN